MNQMYVWVSIATLVTTAITLAWVHLSKQAVVNRSARHSIRIAVCLLVATTCLFLLLCRVCSFSGYVYLFSTGTLFAVSAPLSWKFNPGGDAASFAVGTAVFMPLYIAKQFILGFPDRDHVVLSPPSTSPPEIPAPKAKLGVTVSALRPMGTVDFCGERFNATSDSGIMIQAGRSVQLTGRRGDVLLVSET
jgi:membrane-bound ClpP family serine protease